MCVVETTECTFRRQTTQTLMPHAELRLLPGQGYGRGDDTRYPHFTTGFESLAPLTISHGKVLRAIRFGAT